MTPAVGRPAKQISVGTWASYLRAPSERDTGAAGAGPKGLSSTGERAFEGGACSRPARPRFLTRVDA
jgi:hypothetical protein